MHTNSREVQCVFRPRYRIIHCKPCLSITVLRRYGQGRRNNLKLEDDSYMFARAANPAGGKKDPPQVDSTTDYTHFPHCLN